MKKFLLRTTIYLLILLSLPYLYFVWQAKQGVDAFIISYPLGGEFEYDWILIDLDGNITLYNAALYQKSSDPVFKLPSLEISTTSLFDLVNLREHIIYQEFPSIISVKLKRASSTQTARLAELFGVQYTPKTLVSLYPEECHQAIDKELPLINFDLQITFEIQQTADIGFVKFHFDSKELTRIDGSFKINNLTQVGTEGGYISDLSFQLQELTWLQQNTQKCLTVLNANKLQFIDLVKPYYDKTSKNNGLLFSNSASSIVADFVYIPQTLGVKFKIEEGKTLSQIPFLPLYDYQKETGLKIKLNLNPLGRLFEKYTIETPTLTSTTNATIITKTNIKKNVFLSINQLSLSNNLGAKLKLNLENKTEIVGYLESVNEKGVKIRQLKYKGESILPFSFVEIKTALVLRSD